MICSIVLIALVGSAVALPAGEEFNAETFGLRSLGKAIDDFGLNLLHQLELDERQARGDKHDEAKNILISPFSVSTVLSMLLAGANNTTHDQIFKTLGFNLTNFKADSEIFSSYKTLFRNIKNQFSSDKKNELQVANSIALQKNFKVLQSFLDSVTDNFDSKVFLEDFAARSHESTDDINKWVADKTNGKIAKLFDSDLEEDTAMLLLNAIYFKGSWKLKFNKNLTVPAQFNVHPEKSVIVETMHMRDNFKFKVSNGSRMDSLESVELIELPYNDDLSMLIYLPHNNNSGYKTISSHYKSSKFDQQSEFTFDVRLPKFKINSNVFLNTPLKLLGMTDAFSQSVADFSRIDGLNSLYLSKVVQKAFIDVNEDGSEAAATTVAKGDFLSALQYSFVVNRPFMFMIRDNLHQLNLFTGIVNKP